MTAIVGMTSPRIIASLDVIAIAAAFAFLIILMHPAYDFAECEIYVTTPALEIINMPLASPPTWPACPMRGQRDHGRRRTMQRSKRMGASNGLTDRLLGTGVAALRLLQQGCADYELQEIASNAGAFAWIDESEIDDLCERLNIRSPAPAACPAR